MKHLMYVPFTGLGLKGGFRGDTWLKNRLEVFKKFVIPSLINQKNRDFTLWVQWRPEEEGNHLVMQLHKTLEGIRDFPFIFTYGGLCFEDDKYDRPVSLERLQANLKATLPHLQEVVGKEETVLMTIQPSDDLYLSHAVKAIQDKAKSIAIPQTPQSIGYRQGYMMNYRTLELAEYANQDQNDKTDEESTYNTYTIPPFFTVMFPRAVFLDPEAHMKWTGPYRSHEYIGDHTKYHALEGPGFIVGTHGENISTTWTHRYKGKMIEGDEKETVMLQAGLFGVDKLELDQDKGRVVEKKVINFLPKPIMRAWMRLRSPGIGSAINDYNHYRP